jgi:hypothetical protein
MAKELFPYPGANLTSASHVIDALGGTGKTAAIFGLDDRVVSNWRSRGLPPDTFAVLAPMLRGQGYRFKDALFSQRGMIPVQHKRSKRGRPRADATVTA